MKKTSKIILAIFLTILLVISIGSVVYLSDYYHADDIALEAMSDQTNNILIEQDKNVIWFIPENPSYGMIFYPGGKVEYTAYAPLLRACAEEEILCALVQMPGNLAVLDANAADGLQQEFPDITSWFIAGHSLGGAMAASYAANHSQDFDGLILLAAYSTKELTQTNLRVLSVYGSEDGVMNREAYEGNRQNLPSDTSEIVLNGGCHAQFGSYGPQDGDGVPTISEDEQIRKTTEAILAFIRQ